MFKDSYKAANDDISPDPYLLTRILNKSKEKQKPVFSHFRLAPIAAILALAIALPGIISAPEENVGTVLDEKQVVPATEYTGTYFLAKNTTDTTVTTPSSESFVSVQKSAPANNSPAEQLSHPATVVMSVNSVSPSASKASMRMSEDLYAATEITAAEYFANLGFSPETLDIPDNLAPDFSAETIVTVSKTGDENTFIYTGDSYLSVTTSSSSENAMAYLESEEFEKSTFGDKTAVVTHDGSIYEAHIIHSSGTALKIVTDMPENDLKNLLISAAE